MPRRWKLILMGLTGTLTICMTSCAMTAAALAGAAFLFTGEPAVE